MDLLRTDERGLWCQPGGFHVDPWAPVPVAVVTHAHSDHARPGSAVYYCAAPGESLLRLRVQPGAEIRPFAYGERFQLGEVTVSFHPAGHVLGSAQVRVEGADGVWVASGDYKRDPDPTCAPFEVVACNVFITEATFALPIYRWDPAREVAAQIAAWWRANAAAGRVSVLCAYALGKAQRLLAELQLLADGADHAWMRERPVLLHGALASLVQVYRQSGVAMLDTADATTDAPTGRARADQHAGKLVLAPPSAAGSPWMRRFDRGKGAVTGFASGWMRVRGIRRRRGYDAGFVLSDHADWRDLLRTIRETGASRVLVTHGQTEALARHLREGGTDAAPLRTHYAVEEEE